MFGAATTLVKRDHPHDLGQDVVAVFSVVGLAIGGSMIASAFVARIVATQVFGIDARAALEALRGSSSLGRESQTLTIELKSRGDEVLLSAKHKFALVSASPFPRRLPLSLYTDVSTDGGFYSIVEPNRNVLTQGDLAPFLTEVEGKMQFEKRYWFQPGRASTFVIETYGTYRAADRLIWTVEHISRDFSVVVLDNRDATERCKVKINHHRRRELDPNLDWRDTARGPELSFEYLGEVLPFQGFELRWRDA